MPTLRQQKLVRINKLLAQSTNFSRREIDKLIDEQRIVVDNELVTKQGVQISINSIVKIDDKPINLKSDQQLNDIYIFNKPRGCLVTKSDPKNRKTIYEYIPKKNHNLISIGRLDYMSEGLILLTNNGDLARKFELPSSNILRVYRLIIKGNVSNKILADINSGISINGINYKKIKVNIEKKNKNIRGKKINVSSINKTLITLTKKSKKLSINSLYLTLANWPPSR